MELASGMTPRQTVRNRLLAIWLLAGIWFGAGAGAQMLPNPLTTPSFTVMQPRFGISTGLEYTDNWDQSETNREYDLRWTITPSIAETFKLPFGNAQLTLANSFTFKKSLLGREEDTFDSPASATFGLVGRLGGWQVGISETVTFNNQPLESTLAIGEKKTAQYNSTAALTMSRQMGKLGLALAFQRMDIFAPEEPDTEETSYQFTVTPSYYFNPNLSLFWSHTIGMVQPKDPTRSDSIGYSTSIGLNGRITQTISGSVGIGYTYTHLDPINTVTTNIPAQELPGLNAVLALAYAHPLRPNTTHSLTLAHSPGVTALLNDSNVQESTSATYALLHRLSHGLTVSPSVSWTHVKDVGDGGSGEDTHLVRIGFTLGGAVTDRLGVSLNYFYQTRMSNLPVETYDAHWVGGQLTQRITDRLTATLRGSYETRAGQIEESYNQYDISLGLTQYFGRHLSGTVQYTYRDRRSKLADDSYYENLISATVTWTF